MANIALLVPNDELFRLTHDVLQEQQKRLFLMKVIESERAVMEARQAINQGADIIAAAGAVRQGEMEGAGRGVRRDMQPFPAARRGQERDQSAQRLEAACFSSA